MTCERITSTNTNNTNINNTSYILRTLTRIDQLQKEASVENKCDGCEGSLVSRIYNTKPISIYLCSGNMLEVSVPNTTIQTGLFRIENIQNDAVILRILYRQNDDVVCTKYTVIVGIDCICSLQCFDPICCEECTKTCGQ